MERLWIDFLNSDWHDWRGSGKSADRLDQPDYVLAFARDQGYGQLAYPLPEELADLKSLRELLRRQALRMANGEKPEEGIMEELNQVLERAAYTRKLEENEEGGWQVVSVPVQSGWKHIKADIAASFAETIRNGEESRTRICTNPDCLWVFTDFTRSRTKRYCDDKCCGNLMKVRRFRARRKEESES
ncbi:ABATE domain-containing protein [Paenibacillus sp. CC-CFT747]|nr:ABATE domain-containing protein [Paenibacillus sp. CC-CFT747]